GPRTIGCEQHIGADERSAIESDYPGNGGHPCASTAGGQNHAEQQGCSHGSTPAISSPPAIEAMPTNKSILMLVAIDRTEPSHMAKLIALSPPWRLPQAYLHLSAFVPPPV